MINFIIKLIQSDEWLGMSEEMEIAKGRNQLLNSNHLRVRYVKRFFKTKLKNVKSIRISGRR